MSFAATLSHSTLLTGLPFLFFCKEFRIGQLYNSERDELRNVQVADPIDTTLTTQGYLSNGCSHPITVNGLEGNDLFDVVR